MSDSNLAAAGDFAAVLDGRWDYHQAGASETRFRAELAQWPAGSAPALEIATQIARAQGLQGHFADAHATLDAIKAALDGMPAHVRVRYLLERGRVLNSAGMPERAVPLFQEALDLAQCNADAFYAVDAAHMLGIATPEAQRIEWDRKALAMTEAAPDARTHRWRASLYNNLGWAYHDRGEFETALAYFEQAVPAWEARGQPREVATARWAVARALRSLRRLDAAEAIQRALLAEHEREGTTDGYVFEELGEIALARGDALGARPWFASAYASLRPELAQQPNEAARLARLARLAGAPERAQAPPAR